MSDSENGDEVIEVSYAEGYEIVAQACQKYRDGYTVEQLITDTNGEEVYGCRWAGLRMLLPFTASQVDGRWVRQYDSAPGPSIHAKGPATGERLAEIQHRILE